MYGRWEICSATSSPETPGITMSRKRICGRTVSTVRIAAQPSPASWISPIASSAARWPRSARRARGSSSAITTIALRATGVPRPRRLAGHPYRDLVPRRPGGDFEPRGAAIDGLETLLERAQTVSTAVLRGDLRAGGSALLGTLRGWRPVVPDPKDEGPFRHARRDLHAAALDAVG